VTTGWKTQQTALLLDPEGKAGRAYGAKNTPNMVVINPEGKVVYEGAIDSKATPNPADIPNSTNYVKVALDESLAGKPVTTSTTKPYGCSVKYK
ncbi:MAG: thioredoxin family protein, partial [Verrucomicrobia bacterium]